VGFPNTTHILCLQKQPRGTDKVLLSSLEAEPNSLPQVNDGHVFPWKAVIQKPKTGANTNGTTYNGE
jgi:hypothetical protein